MRKFFGSSILFLFLISIFSCSNLFEPVKNGAITFSLPEIRVASSREIGDTTSGTTENDSNELLDFKITITRS